MTTSIDTSVASLSIRLTEPEFPPTLRDFQQIFEDLESLMFLGSVVATLDPHILPMWWQPELLSGLPIGRVSPGLISPNVLVNAQYVAESFRVVRMSYRSPIEILMQSGGVYGHILAVGGMAFLAVKGALSLWGLGCDTRRKHAETRVAVSDAALAEEINQRLRQTLPLFTGSNLDRVTLDETERRAVLDKPIGQRMEGAARILASAEEIAVVET